MGVVRKSRGRVTGYVGTRERREEGLTERQKEWRQLRQQQRAPILIHLSSLMSRVAAPQASDNFKKELDALKGSLDAKDDLGNPKTADFVRRPTFIWMSAVALISP